MKQVFVNSAKCVSPQETLYDFEFENLRLPEEIVLLNAIAPNYKEYIPPSLLRRMSKTVKMSSVAAQKAMEEAGITNPDAIIVGTGMGCEEDSEKFLKNVIENNEEFLTPTYFIQSTHNTVAGQIALVNSCHAYNFTYVNSGSSLEMSLLDAKLQLENDEAKNILVGATDEKASRTMELYELNGTIKKNNELPADYLHASTPGVIWGEGSAFFVLGTEKSDSAYAALQDVTFLNRLKTEDVGNFISTFLSKNGLESEHIDAVMLGYSGDCTTDHYYDTAALAFNNAQQLYFKHLCGEFNTASGFAFFMANQILKKQQIPQILKINDKDKTSIRNILIYNHLKGEDHSLTLLKMI